MIYIDGEKNTDKAFQNNAFLFGDAVKAYFFVKNSQLIMAEESYFFLMASMRKMRMNIPLSFTLEFFSDIFIKAILENQVKDAVIEILAYRNRDEVLSAKTTVHFYYEIKQKNDVLNITEKYELDLIKEISVNNNLLSNIKVHSPENIYAEIYAKENDLDDVIFLNPNKRIARTIFGNLLLLEENTIKIPKQTEGAYISPLMENFVTFVHKNNLASILEVELSPFETQKAEEILMISDDKGIFTISKIRNKEFGNEKFKKMLDSWKNNF